MDISASVLNHFGAKNTFLILQGQPWRLVTAMFLHANLLHIFFNMWVLLDLGRLVEEIYGWQRFLFFYVVAGIIGYIASVFWSPAVLSIGASGAIMGLAGVLLAYSVRHWNTHGRDFGRRLLNWIAIIFIFGFVVRGVDNAAHLGGLVSGFLIALPVSERRFPNAWQELIDDILGWGAIALVIFSFFSMIHQLNH